MSTYSKGWIKQVIKLDYIRKYMTNLKYIINNHQYDMAIILLIYKDPNSNVLMISMEQQL